MHVGVTLDLRPAEQVGGGLAGQPVAGRVEPARRARAEIDHLGPALPGRMHQREADAAEAAVPGLHRRQRERGRDRGVPRVAAGVEHGDAGQRRVTRLRGDHAALAVGGRLAHVPMLSAVRRRIVGHGGC